MFDLINDFQTVQKYSAALRDMSDADQKRRIEILRDFSNFVDRTPDQMIAEIFDESTMKYKKRGFYSDKVREFCDSINGPRSTKVFSGNVIRAFFIANGRRIPPERPSWM